ncbi:MAG: DUF4142 domain-containing protein [Saprospiraceae bacterium]
MNLFVLMLVFESSGMRRGIEMISILPNHWDTIISYDENFLVTSSEYSLEEIMFSQLALQNCAMAEIKDLAKTVGSTQTNNLNKIKTIASKHQVIVPSVLGEQANKSYKKLGNKTGADFDKEYSEWLVTSYKENIVLFEKATQEGGNDEIKSWTLTALPELRTQLEQAILCQKKCNKM